MQVFFSSSTNMQFASCIHYPDVLVEVRKEEYMEEAVDASHDHIEERLTRHAECVKQMHMEHDWIEGKEKKSITQFYYL